MGRKRKGVRTLYGNTAILKAYCGDCNGYFFVMSGILKCCGRRADKPEEHKTKRESSPEYIRRIPKKDKEEALKLQNYVCVYCGADLMGFTWNRRGKHWSPVKTHYDHFVPWTYSQDSSLSNIVAACSKCNHVKSSLVFNTLDEARVYILGKRGLLAGHQPRH